MTNNEICPIPADVRILSVHTNGVGHIVVETEAVCDGQTVRTEFRLIDDIYMQLKIKIGPSDDGTLRMLRRADELSGAIASAANSLSCGDCSCSGLAVKLINKGYRKSVAENAVKYLKSKGYINEMSAVENTVLKCIAKLWGRMRISAKLYADGYGNQALRHADEMLDGVNFTQNCRILISTKYKVLPNDAAKLKKLKAAIIRYGYAPSEVNAALKELI